MRIVFLIAAIAISTATAQPASAGGMKFAANEQVEQAKTPGEPAASSPKAAEQPRATEKEPQARPKPANRKHKRDHLTFEQRVRYEFAAFERSLRHGFRSAFRW